MGREDLGWRDKGFRTSCSGWLVNKILSSWHLEIVVAPHALQWVRDTCPLSPRKVHVQSVRLRGHILSLLSFYFSILNEK